MRHLSIALCTATLLLTSAPALRASEETCTNQSPRRLDDWNTVGEPATVTPAEEPGAVYYAPAGEPKTKLVRCSEHYHCWIENLQPGCPGQTATDRGGPDHCPAPSALPDGHWVEIHEAYAAELAPGCAERPRLPETLECCAKAPFVVVGHHARVVPGDGGPAASGAERTSRVAEWTGSNTGPDGGGCKTLHVRWHFALGCDATVHRGWLDGFHHPEPARGLQPAARLSQDLNLIATP